MIIGIVAEGPRDCEIIEGIVKLSYPDAVFRYLQPDDMNIATYNGWKGVWQWCINSAEFIAELSRVSSHRIDLYIIHLDGDTMRDKHLHCNAPQSCSIRSITSAAYCMTSQELCPIEIGQEQTEADIETKINYLQTQIDRWMNTGDNVNFIKCTPIESPESWIVAAFDSINYGAPELIINPADAIIGKSAYYHDFRTKRKDGKLKKSQRMYIEFLIPKLCEEWEHVVELCMTAKLFQIDLEKALIAG